jgi:hypothetical protein
MFGRVPGVRGGVVVALTTRVTPDKPTFIVAVGR